MNRKTGEYKLIKRFWEGDEDQAGKEHRLRANDGAVDSQGRYWITVMNDPLVKAPTDEGTKTHAVAVGLIADRCVQAWSSVSIMTCRCIG